MADQKNVTRYKPFKSHDENMTDGTKYHSENLPLPNVVRIEVLSPKAKRCYLGTFHGAMENFRASLTASLMSDDSLHPFYAIFDPETTGDIGFDLRANWEPRNDASFAGMAKTLGKIPIVGAAAGAIANKVVQGSEFVNTMLSHIGVDNTSTGSGTMKSFSKADFQFNKNVKCSWYMPEMEDQARVSIVRLLKMTYVRNFDKNKSKDYASKLAGALKDAFNMSKEQVDKAGEGIKENSGLLGTAAGYLTDGISEVASTAGINPSAILDGVINGALTANEFMGGSITFAPMPVRLTLGHILDIEPLVITGIHITGSKEQFMTSDGSNIPLFVNADIQFDMWMTPDPNKGFLRWLGDDVFTMGCPAAETEKTDSTKDDGSKPAGNSTDTKNNTSGKKGATVGTGVTSNPPKQKGK